MINNTLKHRKKYWITKLGFDLKKELYIYTFLCSGLAWFNLWRVPKEKRYFYYAEWEEYIIKKFVKDERLKNCNYSEFLKHLKYIMSLSEMTSNLTHIYIIPLVLMFISYTIGQTVPINIWTYINNILIEAFSNENQSERIIMIVFFLIVCGIVIFIFRYLFIAITKSVVNISKENAIEYMFYKDLINIIENNIDSRQEFK